MPKLRTLASLSASELRATLEAAGWLLAMQVAVVALPPRLWRRALFSDETTPCDAGPSEPGAARIVRRAVARAARNLPTAPNCLPQALAARQMLTRRGVATSLHLGVARDDRPPRFHAWLKSGDLFVTGDCDEAGFSHFPSAAFPCRQPASLASLPTE